MIRAAAIFIAICMVLIAASVGAVLFIYFGFSGFEAAVVGLGTLTGLAIYNAVVTRMRDRSDLGDQIADMSRSMADLARQVAEVTRQMAGIETRADAAITKARSAVTPLSAEIGELGLLIKQLAETVAGHDELLAAGAEAQIGAQGGTSFAVAGAPRMPESGADAGANHPFAGQDAAAITAIIREAIEANRIDLYLQPIVTLPQRKVRYYEAVSRLRTPDGQIIAAADFLPYAEESRLIAKIDNMMLFRCVQVLRRLLMKNRDVGVFCNISMVTLGDPDFYPQFADFMDANRALAPSLMLEFRQAALRTAGPLEQESLSSLAQCGFRFSIDHVSDLRMEPKDLIDRGVRFVKVGANLILNRSGGGASDIHTADLSDLLGRFGIDLIVERIETEMSAVDLLDFDVRFGQGFLFSPPRAVRAEAMGTAMGTAQGSLESTMQGADGAKTPAFSAIA